MDDAEYELIGYIALPIILLVSFLVFFLVWTGRYRGFATAPKVLFQFSERNTWPLTLFTIGVFVAVMLGFALLGDAVDGLDAESAPVLWAAFWVIEAIVGILVVASFFTWPRFLAPQWYRDWVDRGGTRETDVYSPEEHAAGTARRIQRYPGEDREAGWLVKKMMGRGAPGPDEETRDHDR